jgi:acetoin utilization protein AcuC
MKSPAILVSAAIYREVGYGTSHPLAIQRVAPVMDLCSALSWLDGENYAESPQASFEQLTRFHSADYVEAILEAECAGMVSSEHRKRFNFGTMENPYFPGLYLRASTSVGGSIRAAELAAEGHVTYHPSGGTHHGLPDKASGFCYFNDVVFAVLTLLDQGCGRVLYVDLDAHHGDGVEAAFKADKRVFTISVHEEDKWPHTGKLDDRACGQARNLPVPAGFSDSELAFLMDEAILPVGRKFAPDAVVVTCGADGLDGDPLSAMKLSNTALWNAVDRLVELSASTVVVGGGGYNPWLVARCWTGLWARLAGFVIPDLLPEPAQAILAKLECDLVDEDEVLPEWTNRLADALDEGPVREQVKTLASAVMAP